MDVDDLRYRVQELERLTRNGYSPLALKLRLDATDKKVDNLDEKVDDRFDRLTGQAWKIAGFIVTVMILAATIVSLVLQ